MKGLFKSKPKTPVELVRLVRDHLMYISCDANWNCRDVAKREEKVRPQEFNSFFPLCISLI